MLPSPARPCQTKTALIAQTRPPSQFWILAPPSSTVPTLPSEPPQPTPTFGEQPWLVQHFNTFNAPFICLLVQHCRCQGLRPYSGFWPSPRVPFVPTLAKHISKHQASGNNPGLLSSSIRSLHHVNASRSEIMLLSPP